MERLEGPRQLDSEEGSSPSATGLARGSSLFTHSAFRRPEKRPKTQTTDTAACAIKNCTGLHLEILVYDLN